MADDNELMEFCAAAAAAAAAASAAAAGSPESSGPPIKRLRGDDGRHEAHGLRPRAVSSGVAGGPFGEGTSSRPPGPDECLLHHHPFGPGLPSAALAARFGRRSGLPRQETRSNRPQGARGTLWGEPALFDIPGEALNLVNEAPDLSGNLQWARKSQRQTRASSRLPNEGTPDFLRDRVPESPFRWCSPPPPTHLSSSPPSDVFNFAKGFATPPRAAPVARVGRGGGVPLQPNESGRFNPWEDIWDAEDEVLDMGIFQTSRSGAARRGRGAGQPSESVRPRLVPRSESFPCGFFEPPRSTESAEGSSFPVVNPRTTHGMESRRAALLEAAREQALQQTRDAIQRHRTQRAQRLRERRASFVREEFGALMNALGILQTPDGASDQPHEPRSSVMAMQEAVMGIARSGLPPHLLFSDRDFTGDDYEWLCRLDEGVENRKGADDDTINKLPTVAFDDMDDELEDNDEVEVEEEEEEEDYYSDPSKRCPICLDHFGPGDVLRLMPCQHKYHRSCLDKWLKIKATCPICNLNIKGE